MIASLEDELRVRLLQCSTRRMTLTEVGAKYLGRIEPLLEEIDQARDEALGTGKKRQTYRNDPHYRSLRLAMSVHRGKAEVAWKRPHFRV